ncbi:hypothetical protein ACSFB8_03645 [Enterococcus faecalis]
MSDDILKIAVYPTLAPTPEEIIYHVDAVTELIATCQQIMATNGTSTVDMEQKIVRYFGEYFTIDDFTHHVEIILKNGVPDASKFMQLLNQQFPQVAWLRLGMDYIGKKQVSLLLEFVPIALTDESFPISIHLQQSLQQQFKETDEQLSKLFEQLIHDALKEILTSEKVTVIERPEKQFYETAATKEPTVAKPKKKVARKKSSAKTNRKQKKVAVENQQIADLREKVLASYDHSSQSQSASILDTKDEALTTANFLAIKEEAKRAQASKERLRLVNEKLELVLESLELSMLHSGIKYFDSQLPAEDEQWHIYLKVSLKEYTYLLQKAKYLEQMWHINEELVQKTEKMTVTKNVLTYERGQIHKSALHFSAKDINLVLHECNVIESRVKVRKWPWFKKPYVKIMKMDHDNLLRKAAYFDLLQGESFLLEQKILEYETIA